FLPDNSSRCSLTIRGVPLLYEAKSQVLRIGEHKVNLPLHNGEVNLHIFADRTAFEILASDGLVYVPLPIIPKTENKSLTFQVITGKVRIENLTVNELQSIWKK